MRKKWIGDKAFYTMVMAVAVPIMVQNGITNFVSLLDNIMVGRIGTEQMSGVAIVNQLLMVYYLCIFGGISGAGIFTAQYFGRGDREGIRHTFRYKFWMAVLLTVGAVAVFLCFGRPLICMYLNGGGDGGDLQQTLASGLLYLRTMLWGLPAFMMLQIYAGTLRECGQTVVPMKASIVAVLVNLVLNYLLIYGKFGLPALGVRGAAIATVISRYVEAAIVLAWTHHYPEQNPFIVDIYKTLRVPLRLVKLYFIKGMPLLVNEALWSSGMAALTQCYSLRGLSVVAGLNICGTISNLFNVAFIAMGDAVAIIVGQLLGAGKLEEAKDTDRKIIAFSVLSCVGIAAVMFCLAPLFPRLYNTSTQARQLAMQFIMVQALCMPQNAFMHVTYFTLRAGGKTMVTFFFDSVFVWCISIPIAYVLSRYTALYVVAVVALVQMGDWIKCVIGYVLVKKGVWLQNIVNKT